MTASALVGAVALVPFVASCSGHKGDGAPPHATDMVKVPRLSSTIAVPITADQAAILGAIEKGVPHLLWTIDKRTRCVAPQKVKIFGKRISVTPPLGCRIVGEVTRGPIRLHGHGQDLIADVPLTARISARDIGGILKGETATGGAMAHARIRLDLTPDWRPRGTVKLHYDWTTPPGIDFLGQRISFTEQADQKLAPVVRQLERDLPRELDRLDLRGQADKLWRQSFTTIKLNDKHPPVWMRVTPERIIYSGYTMEGGRLNLRLGLNAYTETFVGPRPAPPAPTPLPRLTKAQTDGRFRFFIPVVADYKELEPVILRALVKRSARPFDLPGIGPVTARFEKAEAYGTTGNRIAVGLTLAAKPTSGLVGETRGKIWITARPVNAPGSARVQFTDVEVTGDTDRVAGDILVELVSSPGVSGLIAGALVQNFAHDLDSLLGKVRRALDAKQEGSFLINARISAVQTGVIVAHGQGLYLPVRATGDARIAYRPN